MIFAQNLLKILMATWVVLYAIIMAFGVLIDSGPTDFNGNPNTLFDHVTNTGMLILDILMIGLVGMLIRKVRISIFLAIVAAAALPWVVNAIVYHDVAALAFPAVFTMGLGLLYATYTFIAQPLEEPPKSKARSKPAKTSAVKKS